MEPELWVLWRADSLFATECKHLAYFCHVGSRPPFAELLLGPSTAHGYARTTYCGYAK